VTLEIAKLWETAYRAILIASWQELHRICNKLDADIGNVSDFIQEVNNTLKDRPVLYPDYIGGHCLIPNTELLKSVFDSKLLEFVLESNNKRLTEVQDPIIIDDLEKVKKTWIQNIPKWYYKDAIP
jgi:UDP-N-acetyl-D-mannosaminuronate dehydrogenase